MRNVNVFLTTVWSSARDARKNWRLAEMLDHWLNVLFKQKLFVLLVTFFHAGSVLRKMDIAHCRFPVETTKHVLSGNKPSSNETKPTQYSVIKQAMKTTKQTAKSYLYLFRVYRINWSME